MARKIECDNCGTLVEDKGSESDVNKVTMTYTLTHKDNGYVLPNYDRESADLSKDLCLLCQKQLLELFNKKEDAFSEGG